MNRYENGKIYKLVNDVDDSFYIGSTCLQLPKRLYYHKNDSNKAPNRRVYKHFLNIGWENIRIILIELFPCANKMELEKRERYYIDTLKPDLNKNKPYLTPEEKEEYDMKRIRTDEYKMKQREKDIKRKQTEEYKAKQREYQQTEESKAKKRIWDQTYRERKKEKGINTITTPMKRV